MKKQKTVKKTYSEYLSECANNFMPEEDVDVEVDELEDDEMGDELEDGDLEGEEIGDELEEEPQISVADAIRAIQLVLNGEAETAEDALDIVQNAEEVDGDELEGDEIDAEIDEPGDSEEIEMESEEVDAEDMVDEEEEDIYGESHSKFLSLSRRYL